MKKNEQAAKNLSKLLDSLKKKYKDVEQPHGLAPITQMLLSFLQWNTTAANADAAFDKIMAAVIDFTELRVTHLGELVDIIGETYPQAQIRLERLLEALNEIYQREHKTDMTSLKGKAKKEIKVYLETLPGLTPYTIAQITLLCFGGHAIPVDDHLASLLVDNKVADNDASPKEITAFLEKQIRSSDALEAHTVFQAWADENPVKKPKTKKKSTKKAKTTSKITKKITEKIAEKVAEKIVEKEPTKAAVTKTTKAPATKKKAAKKAAKKVAKKSKTTKTKKPK